MNVIDEYIQTCPEHHRKIMVELKRIIESVDTTMEQKLSWGMPTFKKKKFIIHFADAKNHIGLHVGREAIEHFSDRLVGYNAEKSTIRLPIDGSVDEELVRDIVKFNIELDENL